MTMIKVNSICNITAFNHQQTDIFQCEDADEDSMVLLIDHSLSIKGPNEILLRTSVAALTKGTNAEGKFVIPEPLGNTAIIQTVKNVISKYRNKTYVIFTDGCDTMYNGDLEIGNLKDGSAETFPWIGSAENRHELLANWLQGQGVKICLLGIGEHAKPMLEHMLQKSNVFVGYIDHTLDMKKIFAVVDTLRKISKKNSTGMSSTRNGVQHVLLLSDNIDVEQTMLGLSVSDLEEIETSIGHVQIVSGQVVCESDVKIRIDEVFKNYMESNDIIDSEMDVKAGIMFALRQMCNQLTPGAMVSSNYSAVIGAPLKCPQFGTHCNRIFGKLARVGILKKGIDTPAEGVEMEIDGIIRSFKKDCAQYSCNLPKEIIDKISNDETYCTPLKNFPPLKNFAAKKSSKQKPSKGITKNALNKG